MTKKENSKKLKRIVGWTVFYLIVFGLFLLVVFKQSEKVNTLDFPNGQIVLTTSKTKYTVGQQISYTVKNNLNSSLEIVNKCPNVPFHIYSWANNTWTRLNSSANTSACKNQPKQQTLKPGQSLTANFSKWPKLFDKPGIYRIVAFASNYTALPYADFQVVDKPTAPTTKIIVKEVPIYKPVYTPIYLPAPSYTGDGGGGGDN